MEQGNNTMKIMYRILWWGIEAHMSMSMIVGLFVRCRTQSQAQIIAREAFTTDE